MANIKDVAKRAGVAVSTVSKYINGGSVRKYNAEAIQEAIDALDFKLNDLARSLKTNKAMTVGILIPSLESSFFTGIATKMEDGFLKKGYGIMLCDYRNDFEMEKEKLEFLVSKRVDGLVVVPYKSMDFIKTHSILRDIPIVAVDRPIEDRDSVYSASTDGAKKAVEYLIMNGHKKIAIISGPYDIQTANLRLDGYKQAHEENGLSINEEYIKYGNYTLSGGYTQMSNILRLKDRPTAVFVSNYDMTLGAMIAMSDQGQTIPKDMSLIGFDDMDMTKIVSPPLTVVSQPLDEISQEAVRLLLDRMMSDENKKATVTKLPTELVIRDSVKKIN